MIMKKNMYTKSIALCAVLFSNLTVCMDAPKKTATDVVLFDERMAQRLVLPVLNLQSLGRFASVCKKFQNFSFEKVHSLIPINSVCFNDLVSNYAKCSRGLHYFAQQNNEKFFQKLWSYHAQERQNELRSCFGSTLTEFPFNTCMHIYSNEYKKIEEKREKKNKAAQKADVEREKQKRRLLRRNLLKGEGNVGKLHTDNMDIADIFPKKKPSQLFDCLCNNTEDHTLLAAMGGDYISSFPDQAFHCLLKYRRFGAILAFVSEGVFDINAQSKSGETILHHMNHGCCYSEIMEGFYRCSDPVDLVDEAINIGANVNIVDNKGRTCLHYACKYLHVKTVNRLLRNGNMDVNKKDAKGKRPINLTTYFSDDHWGGVKADIKMVKMLLKGYVAKNAQVDV